jgi:hypothetical protein
MPVEGFTLAQALASPWGQAATLALPGLGQGLAAGGLLAAAHYASQEGPDMAGLLPWGWGSGGAEDRYRAAQIARSMAAADEIYRLKRARMYKRKRFKRPKRKRTNVKKKYKGKGHLKSRSAATHTARSALTKRNRSTFTAVNASRSEHGGHHFVPAVKRAKLKYYAENYIPVAGPKVTNYNVQGAPYMAQCAAASLTSDQEIIHRHKVMAIRLNDVYKPDYREIFNRLDTVGGTSYAYAQRPSGYGEYSRYYNKFIVRWCKIEVTWNISPVCFNRLEALGSAAGHAEPNPTDGQIRIRLCNIAHASQSNDPALDGQVGGQMVVPQNQEEADLIDDFTDDVIIYNSGPGQPMKTVKQTMYIDMQKFYGRSMEEGLDVKDTAGDKLDMGADPIFYSYALVYGYRGSRARAIQAVEDDINQTFDAEEPGTATGGAHTGNANSLERNPLCEISCYHTVTYMTEFYDRKDIELDPNNNNEPLINASDSAAINR